MLLRAGEGKFRHSEFVMALKQCLPMGSYSFFQNYFWCYLLEVKDFFLLGVDANLDYLRGLALVEKEGMQQPVLHLFPEYDLPENIPERFRLLFKRKEKWTLDEIRPYIE